MEAVAADADNYQKAPSQQGVLFSLLEVFSMVKQVREFCKQNNLLKENSKLVVACSGGPDSMAMLDMLLVLQKEMGFKIVVAHFEHGIRGQESLEDAAFVQEYCDECGVNFFLEHGNVPEWAKAHGESLETAARKLRYDFLQRVADSLGGADIATAHHRNDQAETVIMHILRGSGLTGLSGIRPRRGNIIRPVLFLSKEQLLDYCYMNGIEARMDRTNEIADCTRNRIRLNLMPNLASSYNQGITEGLCHLAEIASIDGDYLQQEAVRVYDNIVDKTNGIQKIKRENFLQLHEAMKRRLLQQIIRKAAGVENGGSMGLVSSSIANLGYIHVRLLRDFIEKGKTGTRISLPGDVQAAMNYGTVSVYKKTLEAIRVCSQEPTQLNIPGETYLPELNIHIVARIYKGQLPENLRNNKDKMQAVFDYQQLQGRLTARVRQEGDRVHLQAGSKKLKEFFIDRKIPREERFAVPLVCDNQGILWMVGIQQTKLSAVSNNTDEYLVLNCERGM